ncbi:alpha-tubulin N-acetyltransferase, putative [Plasmodium malariae]|uniref:Alpha-tubulin N-acetyltransferase n=1 Tax=Plasmodium malariae TaxID=5858 RepID=A0A1D3JMY8_PLAMA|nr:alpha-tubulin N-acetyltransferase, putative [Plasmodium malariae]SBT87902.1 alpha-tubulin N-acetyltransferase, putative [Plasmodium malariae]
MKCVPSNKPPGEIKQLQIKKFTRDDLLFRRLENDVHKISHLSSKDQKLYGVLTSLVNIMDNDYKLYCLTHQNNLIGILKIGTKNLYLYDKKKLHYRSCTCVLDFYIMKDFQKRGLGIELFNCMLRDNTISPSNLCYDNPSYKMQNFLKKYFAPCNLIKQPNNFVTFDNYFV